MNINNYSYNLYSKDEQMRYREDMQRLLDENDHDTFRENAKEWLKHNASRIEIACDMGGSINEEILTHSIPVLKRISSVAKSTRFAVVGFNRGKQDCRIPVLQLIPEDGSKEFIRSDIPEAPKFEIRNKEDADYLTSLLASSGIPTNAAEGCDAKTELSCRFLQTMGIADSRIQKIIVKGFFIPIIRDDAPSVCWRCHVAPLVKTGSREFYVLDTFFDAKKALSIDAWLQRLGGLAESTHKVQVSKSYDPQKNRFVETTDAVFESQNKRMSFYDFSSYIGSNNFVENTIYKEIPNLDFSETQAQTEPTEVRNPSTTCNIS